MQFDKINKTYYNVYKTQRGEKMESRKYNNIVEILTSIFTVKNGEVKVLLLKKQSDPYKGYWIIPSDFLSTTETIEERIDNTIYDKIGLNGVETENCGIYSDINRDQSARIVGISYMGIASTDLVEFKIEQRDEYISDWFNIDNIPKMGYDHEFIIKDTIEYLKKRLLDSKTLKKLFPSDFTLPELQRIYEQILGYELDRRNFRKKFINLDLIEETGDKTSGGNGRPAKLYRFNDDIDAKKLF